MNNIFYTYAKKTLKKNRTRTIVTTIGIVLSTAMITAVATIISSIRAYGIRYEEAIVGDWQVEVDGVSKDDRAVLSKDDRVARVYLLSNLGYAMLPGGQNEYKIYLCIRGMDDAFAENMPLHLTEGRMPAEAGEILVPEHVAYNGGVEYSIGDVITLDVGRRVSTDGQELLQDTALLYMELDAAGDEDDALVDSEHEYRAVAGENQENLTIVPIEGIVDAQLQTYTVVGFYERPAFEATSSPGYTLLTMDDVAAEADTADMFIIMRHAWNAIPFYQEIEPEYAAHRILCNNALLRFYGVSARSDFNYILYGMGGILIVIIVVGSVALIYNAFAISIGERTREFGMLASIGATRRQLRQSVRYEALRLCIFGIPLGILAGIFGIGITLSFFRGVFEYLIGDTQGVIMRVSVSPGALAVTVVVAVTTVLLSAHLPMLRALKVSAVAAIRQSGDIRVGRRVRLPLWARNYFDGERGNVAHGLALKNFARNKKSYRATIFSLAMSIVLFVSAGCFSEYLFGSYQNAVDISPYDVDVYFYGEDYMDTPEQLKRLRTVEGIAEVYHTYNVWTPYDPSWEALTEEAQEVWRGNEGAMSTNTYLNFLPDDVFAELTDYYGLDVERYYSGTPRAVVFNTVQNPFIEEVTPYQMLKPDCGKVVCTLELSDGTDYHWELPVGDIVAQELYGQQAFSERCLSLSWYAHSIALIYPESRMEELFATIGSDVMPWSQLSGHAYFLAVDHAAACEKLEEILGGRGFVHDAVALEEEYRMVRLMVNVFCDGFIVLLSLIAAANVFNTISTNMNVRRREFAMLKSIGMTPREFSDMLNFECIVYGCRGLLAGLLASLPCAVFMYYLGHGTSFEGFYLPMRFPAVSAVCVFVLVYVTMRYGQRKMRGERLMDVLKN